MSNCADTLNAITEEIKNCTNKVQINFLKDLAWKTFFKNKKNKESEKMEKAEYTFTSASNNVTISAECVNENTGKSITPSQGVETKSCIMGQPAIKWSGKWIEIKSVCWRREGQIDSPESYRTWEYVSRKNNHSTVMIITYDSSLKKAILTKEFRPPIGDYEIAFPAGLIEEGEDWKDAAVRECREELDVKVIRSIKSSGMEYYNSAGLTDESCYVVFMDIDSSTLPSKTCNMGESIDILVVDVKEIINMLYDKNIKMGAKTYFALHHILYQYDAVGQHTSLTM